MRVQCQITRRYLDDRHRVAEGVWVCPYCLEGEPYLQANIVHPELCSLMNHAIERARALFEKPDDGIETRIWLGDHPETVSEDAEGAVHIYLGRSSNWLQFNYSGAHEALHRVCSPCNGTGTWVDEMLAVLFSLRYLEEVGLTDHANLNERHLRDEAAKAPLTEVLNNKHPDGVYGRCFLIGEALIATVGWDGLIRLDTYRDANGVVDFGAWVDSLPARLRGQVRTVLAAQD